MKSTTETGTTNLWPWPDSLDALRVAPKHHTLILENERVRVVRTYIPAGNLVSVHTHRWPGVVHILSWSDFIRRDDNGKVRFDSRSVTPPQKLPAVQYTESLPPHSVENIGNADIDLYIVELKDAPAKCLALPSAGLEGTAPFMMPWLRSQTDSVELYAAPRSTSSS